MRLSGPLVGLVSRLMSPFVDLVSWVPARVQFKLLAAFFAIAMLLIMVGAVALEVLSGVHQRVDSCETLSCVGGRRPMPVLGVNSHAALAARHQGAGALLKPIELEVHAWWPGPAVRTCATRAPTAARVAGGPAP